ncbi:MAG: hypothetical protein JWP87_197 [Labilithrix sp.]|nr:hypothetical protein [Labilithrix sp.]
MPRAVSADVASEPSHAGGAMSARAIAAVLACAVFGLAACAQANGYDPSRYPSGVPVILVDPEIEPLPPSPKRHMRDPRGDGGIDGHTPSAAADGGS